MFKPRAMMSKNNSENNKIKRKKKPVFKALRCSNYQLLITRGVKIPFKSSSGRRSMNPDRSRQAGRGLSGKKKL